MNSQKDSKKRGNKRASQAPSAVFSIGSAGEIAREYGLESIHQRLGEIPDFVTSMGFDTTEPSSTSNATWGTVFTISG